MDFSENTIAFIKANEGFRQHPYQCTAGKTTIGYGWNLTDDGITEYEAEWIMKRRLIVCVVDLRDIFPSWYLFTDHRKMALTDMRYNLGLSRFNGFKKMIAAIKAHNWGVAASEAKDSKWFTQVGCRGGKVVRALRNG